MPKVFGSNVDVLPYRGLNLSKLLPAASRTSTWTNLVAELASTIGSVCPDIIVMPFPQLDTQSDHQYPAVAVVEAMQGYRSTPRFLHDTNHAGGERYPYGPAGGLVGLPPTTRSIEVQSVCSHVLDEGQQTLKLFALEAHHDLRLSPREQRNCGRRPRRPSHPREPSRDYFRRAMRANELFFVFHRAGAEHVVARFLEEERG